MSAGLAIILPLTLLVALLYSSVGHGGASGYLAAMSLVGMAPSQMKPTALVLNLLVAGVGSYRYIRQGCFSRQAFIPFALGSIPFAFVGGGTKLADPIYERILGVALIVAAVGMLWKGRTDRPQREIPFVAAIFLGAGIGFLSGLIGVGGGIFLSPILILSGWATTRQTLGVSSLFILVNSLAGLAGHLSSLQNIPSEALYLGPIALAGGLLGSYLGSKRFSIAGLRILLALVLLIAAGKMLVA